MSKRQDVLKLKAEGLDAVDIALESGLTIYEVEDLLEVEKTIDRTTNKRSEEILAAYKEGETLDSIGKKHGITRERIRQIIKVQVANELGYSTREAKHHKEEIKEAVKSLVHNSREERVEDNVEERLNEALEKGIDPQYIDSLLKFTNATGISADNLQKYKPELYNQIIINQRRRKRRWSTYYDACKMCGLTDNKHRSSGYCVKCYAKTPEWKEMVKMSYLRNKKTRQLANKKFREEYIRRPGVAEKLQREYDEKYFGGNRKAALERDGNKCLSCGMSTEVKDKLGRQKVRVWHLNDTEDNSLENLGTYDQSCFIKKYGSHGRFR